MSRIEHTHPHTQESNFPRHVQCACDVRIWADPLRVGLERRESLRKGRVDLAYQSYKTGRALNKLKMNLQTDERAYDETKEKTDIYRERERASQVYTERDSEREREREREREKERQDDKCKILMPLFASDLTYKVTPN